MAITKVTRNLLSTGIDDQSNATAITIDSSENVGIGGSPSKKLTVSSDGVLDGITMSGANAPIISVTNTQTTSIARMLAQTTFSSLGTASNHPLVLITNDTERLRIDTSGNVGIGTSNATPSNGEGMCLGSSSAITRLDMRNSTTGDATGDGTSLQLNGNNFTIENREAGYVAFSTSLTERMRIDASGNVQIGTGTPAYLVGTSDIAQLSVNRVGTSGAITNASRSAAYINVNGADGGSSIEFNTADANNTQPTEAMRLDSSGNLLVGTTTASDAQIISKTSGSSYNMYYQAPSLYSGGYRFIRFQVGSPLSTVGAIESNGSTTTYSTSSDYRLKENVDYDFNALDRVAQLKPARFNFIADETNTTVDGFLAHEVQDIIPEAISGEKDAVDDEGNPEYQGIDQSKLVPLLTKAIQEQQTIIDDLKTRIETLENA